MNQAATLKQWRDMHKGRIGPINNLNPKTLSKTVMHPRVLSFTSGKGGVGKTNVVANLALALSQCGKKVMLLDADLGLANIDVLLGLVPKYNIKHVFSGQMRLQDVLIKGPGGILVLPAGSGIPELVSLTDGEKLFLLTEMEELDDKIDILLIDTPAGISDNVVYFNLAAQGRVVILTPEPTSITDAYALIKVLANKHQIKSFYILINWVKDSNEAQKVFRQLAAVVDRFLGSLSLDFIGYIPHDDAIPKAVRKQKAVLDLYPNALSSKGFINLAQSLLREGENSHVDGNIKFFWKHLLRV